MSLLKICTLLGVFFAFNSSTIPYCASISASVLNFKRNAGARIKPFALGQDQTICQCKLFDPEKAQRHVGFCAEYSFNLFCNTVVGLEL